MRFLRKGPRLPYETRARWPERCRLGGSCRKSPTSGNPTISKRFPRRIRHQCGISLLPEQEQTRDAVVEANTWTTIQTDFLDQLIRENCLGVQDNLETVVEFVLRSPRWELSLVAPWLRLQPAKLAPFFAGANSFCGKRSNHGPTTRVIRSPRLPYFTFSCRDRVCGRDRAAGERTHNAPHLR